MAQLVWRTPLHKPRRAALRLASLHTTTTMSVPAISRSRTQFPTAHGIAQLAMGTTAEAMMYGSGGEGRSGLLPPLVAYHTAVGTVVPVASMVDFGNVRASNGECWSRGTLWRQLLMVLFVPQRLRRQSAEGLWTEGPITTTRVTDLSSLSSNGPWLTRVSCSSWGVQRPPSHAWT
jgi:hypothetical protein